MGAPLRRLAEGYLGELLLKFPRGFPSVPGSLERRPWFFPTSRVVSKRGGAVESMLHTSYFLAEGNMTFGCIADGIAMNTRSGDYESGCEVEVWK